jgi:hypothetical protein
MKNSVFLTVLLLLPFSLFSQTKIDYNNFNVDTATKVFAKVFLEFRDTAVHFASGVPHVVPYPVLSESPELRRPRWSDFLYEQVSLPNCKELYKYGNHVFHVDREEWYKTNINTIRQEYYKGIKNVPQCQLENARLIYSENAFSTSKKFDTYEELASFIIMSWENSITHKCAQRGILYDSFSYKEYGLKIQDIFSCCVVYNPLNGHTKAVINFIE